jgi:signal transduction histidine kinase
MEQQMAHTDKLVSIGQLSAGVAHEINNPLSIILGYTQLLLRNEDPENQRYGDLKIIEKHVRNCKTIVEDLLNFSRSSETRKEIVRIHDLIDEVIAVFHHRKGSESIEIERNYDFNAPDMYCDEKQIKQVMINLLMNAEHAVGKQGKIGITSRYDDLKENISICIKDNGYGIEKGIQNRIFDPFFTTKPTGEGTGLGLSVSYGIIKNHGGDIHLKSKAGEGAEFTVSLPAKSFDEKSL